MRGTATTPRAREVVLLGRLAREVTAGMGVGSPMPARFMVDRSRAALTCRERDANSGAMLRSDRFCFLRRDDVAGRPAYASPPDPAGSAACGTRRLRRHHPLRHVGVGIAARVRSKTGARSPSVSALVSTVDETLVAARPACRRPPGSAASALPSRAAGLPRPVAIRSARRESVHQGGPEPPSNRRISARSNEAVIRFNRGLRTRVDAVVLSIGLAGCAAARRHGRAVGQGPRIST